jgi:LuxR family maltose regulon positive regulatory protein
VETGISEFSPGSQREDRASPVPSFELVDSKLEPPEDRPGTVERTALVNRVSSTSTVPVIAVVAPPGYGKTTFLAQWARRRGPRVAWLSCDDGDNDPKVLLTYLAVALNRVAPITPTAFRALTSAAPAITVVHRLTGGNGTTPPPVSVVIDHAEALTNADSVGTLAEFVLRLPPGWQVAIASRHNVPLPVGRLRARGEIAEIGPADLAMDATEASGLMTGAGVELAEADVSELVERTEGWPAGLYLAALSMKAGTSHRQAGFTVTRDEAYMADYVRSELLDRASPSEVSFLTRTSVLDRMCGPLCDATLGAGGSAGMLEQLASRNLLTIPLDRRHDWYRYHHLLRRLLHTELERREPGIIDELNSRAAEWFRCHGMPEAAIRHAQATGDTDRVARLVLDAVQPVWASGRADTVLRWMEWLEAEGVVERYPAIGVHGALIQALLGRPAEADRWAAVAERGPHAGRLPDGSTVESILAYLRAILCRDGVASMRRDAFASWKGLSPVSPYRATMLYTGGISHLLEGDSDRADPLLANAFDDATGTGAQPLAALILAERCIAAADRNELPEVEELAQRALSIVQVGHFEDYWTSALVYSWAAQVALHRGEVSQARDQVGAAARLRPLLTYVLPVVSVQTLIQIARVYVALGDPAGAEAVLRQADEIRQRRPRLGNLWAQADRLRSRIDRIRGNDLGASSLTAAELRLLPLLSTHLSLQEIGQQLHVSRHTVKTQTLSVYRKLGVSSRGEAVMRARELGLHLV